MKGKLLSHKIEMLSKIIRADFYPIIIIIIIITYTFVSN